jgi:hypothetical protein
MVNINSLLYEPFPEKPIDKSSKNLMIFCPLEQVPKHIIIALSQAKL